MILADTSDWIDHLRTGDKVLAALLDAGMVVAHPFVIGELALGNLRRREVVLQTLAELPQASSSVVTRYRRIAEQTGFAGAEVRTIRTR